MDVASQVDVFSRGKEKNVVTFNPTPLMSTYLVAFTVGHLKMIETNSFRVPIRVFAAEDKNVELGRFNLELTSRTLKAFEKIFDIDFPLPKLDLIAIPGANGGAMENWGLVTFDERLLLVNKKENSAEVWRRGGSVMVHKLAHQWVGNLVTMDFWEGLWLNEGFADWEELYAWEILEPGWKMWESYASGGFQDGLELDSNRASHPIKVPVNRAGEINQNFDNISYAKGCAVVRMISSF